MLSGTVVTTDEPTIRFNLLQHTDTYCTTVCILQDGYVLLLPDEIKLIKREYGWATDSRAMVRTHQTQPPLIS